jgi:hypothetical protein
MISFTFPPKDSTPCLFDTRLVQHINDHIESPPKKEEEIAKKEVDKGMVDKDMAEKEAMDKEVERGEICHGKDLCEKRRKRKRKYSRRSIGETKRCIGETKRSKKKTSLDGCTRRVMLLMDKTTYLERHRKQRMQCLRKSLSLYYSYSRRPLPTFRYEPYVRSRLVPSTRSIRPYMFGIESVYHPICPLCKKQIATDDADVLVYPIGYRHGIYQIAHQPCCKQII